MREFSIDLPVPMFSSDINAIQNASNKPPNVNELWRHLCCYKCGRRYPETVLNLEGMFHHHEKPRCLDTKKCQRIQRKLKERQ
jgi:hypothetical protein